MIVAHNSMRGFKLAQRGVGLIEVLIALVVFAIGVVGMAGLQLRTVSLTMDSSQRTYVISKSQDIADRIRANKLSVTDYLDTYNETGDFCQTVPTSCSDTTAANVGACTPAQMSTYDLYDAFCVGDGSLDNQVVDWEAEISCATPDAAVFMVDTPLCDQINSTVTITTSWYARTADLTAVADEPTDSMTLSFAP